MKPADVIAWTIVVIGILPIVAKALSAVWQVVRRA
jgi:hypothetical protein